MNQQELLADLARLKDMDKPPTVFAVWNLKKLIWLYEQMLAKRHVLLMSGGDWADASADLIDVPSGVDLQAEHDAYRKWYRESYVPSYTAWSKLENKYSDENRQLCMKYLSFKEWLLSKGCAANTTIEVFEE